MLTIDKNTNLQSGEFYHAYSQDGVALILDKPFGWTSFDVVKAIRKKLRRITNNAKCKVGHCGTLDPMATGLIIVCLGKATKKIDTFQGMDKTYHAELRLGAVTKSNDRETEETDIVVDLILDTDSISNALSKFLGEQQQIPPMHSAIRKDGKRLYELARRDVAIEVEPRAVYIHSIEQVEWASPLLRFSVQCSKGTYIRSLARDIGTTLGCGGYLHNLRRTKNGSIDVANALSIEAALELMTIPESTTIEHALELV